MVKREVLDYSKLRVFDLTKLPARRMRIKGTVNYVSDAQRGEFGGREYLLVREPDNTHDSQAIAVYGRQRKLGHVAASAAASMSPLLDQIVGVDGFVVGGTAVMDNSIRLWVDLPTVPELRALVKRLAKASAV